MADQTKKNRISVLPIKAKNSDLLMSKHSTAVTNQTKECGMKISTADTSIALWFTTRVMSGGGGWEGGGEMGCVCVCGGGETS